MTAEELADELDVSKRTICRDIDALSVAGVPVYANSGPGGGYALLVNYRTNLTGLYKDEIRALFMLTIPGPISDLGVSQQLKAAILEMTSSFAGDHYVHTDFLRQRLHLDAASWFQCEILKFIRKNFTIIDYINILEPLFQQPVILCDIEVSNSLRSQRTPIQNGYKQGRYFGPFVYSVNGLVIMNIRKVLT